MLYNGIAKGERFMDTKYKKLGEAELEIMQVIWQSDTAVTSGYIQKELKNLRKWQLSTLMTSLTRLADKGFVNCDRSCGTNLYSALISENDYKAGASQSFLKRMYNSSVQGLVATLYGNKMFSSEDVKELRSFLDELEGKIEDESKGDGV